jgi:protein-S-isoprenylcysteine O-methyltransferase Ste14
MFMEVQNLIQYVSYLLIAIGIMAFLVSAITQVIKSWPGLDSLPTSVVVIVLSLILCPVIFIALMSYLKQPIEWYMLVACFLAAFMVALVAMDGWERVREIWNRSKYNKER